uniref:Uncharacterized protein n=1 Tax=Avena sativa TaxID=4498 RepID=A0ACD5Y1J2_AVESA
MPYTRDLRSSALLLSCRAPVMRVHIDTTPLLSSPATATRSHIYAARATSIHPHEPVTISPHTDTGVTSPRSQERCCTSNSTDRSIDRPIPLQLSWTSGAMPCLAHEFHQPRLPATNHCKSLSCLIRETYAHCHVPCVGRIRGAGWSSGDDDSDDDDALDTKQVILNEMRNRQLKRKESRCSVVESPTLSSAFVWSFTPLDPRSVLDKFPSPEKRVSAAEEEKDAASDAGHADADDVQSEAFFSVKSFFTRSTSRAATVASSADIMDLPAAANWEGFRDCEGWPFGLCRRPAVPPLPSTPADSWKWRKQMSSSNLAVASPARAYSYKTTTSLPASPLAKKSLN